MHSEPHRKAREISRREEPQIRTHTAPTTGTFLYNSRVWIPFLPSLLVLLSLGGKVTIGTVIVGLMVAYICDVRGSKEGTLVALWGTLLASEFGLVVSGAFLFQHSLVNMFLLFNVAVFLVVTGMWGSLQAKWLTQFELAVLGMERCIFAITIYPCSVLLTWVAIASQGIDNAPFYLLLFLVAHFYLFGLPTKSSFRPRDAPGYILGKFETIVMTGALIFLPAISYISIYHSVLTRSLLHTTNIVLLITLPLLVLSLLVNQGSLWWIAPNYYVSKQPTTESEVYLEKLGKLLRFVIIIVVVGCLEHRLVFHSPSLYHALALFPPWSYIIVTIAVYSVVAIAYYLRTAKSARNMRVLLLGLGTLSGFSAGLVLGAPMYVYPFILLVVHSLVSFYFKRRFFNYLLFVVGAVVCLSWFVAKTYAYIDFSFSGLQMSYVAVLIVVQFALTLLVPGLMAVAFENLPGVAGLVLFLHAVSVAVLEHILYTQDTEVYPYYLVIATTIAGSCVFYKLHQRKKVTIVWRWLGTSVYVSKLALALTSVDYAMIYTFFLILSVTVLYIIPSSKISSQQGFLHAILIGFMVFFARNAILAKLISLFTNQSLSTMGTFACFLIAWGLGLIPLSFRFFAHKPLVRAANFALIACGALLYLVSTAVPTSRSQSLPQQGTSLAKWFLLAGLVPLIFVMTSLINLNRYKKLRLVMPVIIGLCLGLYVSGSFVPLPPPRTAYSSSVPFAAVMQHTLHGVVLACAGVLISLAHWPPPPSSAHIVLWVYSAFACLFPVLFVLDSQVYMYAPTQKRKDSVLAARVVLMGLYAATSFLISLFLKLEVSRSLSDRPSDRKRETQPPRRASSLPSDWNATIGNFATFCAFIYSTVLQISYLGGSEIAVLVLAPVLLLLNRDVTSRWLRHLNESNRYFPILFTISGVLIGYSFKRVFLPSVLPLYTSLGWWRTKNLLLLLLTLPSQYLFNSFLWDSSKAPRSPLLWLVFSLFCSLPLLLADLQGIQCLAVLGAAGWVVQYLEGLAKKNKLRSQVL
eukprot:Phypoly_transcript_01600.p1 GENE.Phypoly_transcript_01600~~Phypoly_transcript_01600.p1  ORF type:complete len:1030 (+),score=82.52 Phypoly_transcript_01600:85-3174(+)